MRVVAGLAKGRRLAAPARGTRPTSDRAREALFSSLAARLDLAGARVLDLFAGTGAVGLEALSRGAGHVIFVESDRRAAQVLAANIAAVGLDGAVLRRTAAEAFLAAPDDPGPFRLVFADPPYACADDALEAVLTGVGRLLEVGGLVVVERSARSPEPSWPESIEPVQRRRYGEGVLWYGRRE